MDVRVYEGYFASRGVEPPDHDAYRLPRWLADVLPADRGAAILDVGCGHGLMLDALRRLGYTNARGVDVSPDAVAVCRARGLAAERIDDLAAWAAAQERGHDLVLMSHVLEHVEKPRIVPVLRAIRERLLAPGGAFVVMVPNAQSATGCYWAYEDFTHETLFTAGSLLFVLRAAGFTSAEFLDPEAVSDSPPLVRLARRVLLHAYRANLWLWNRVTGSSFHRPSPEIFSFELKARARADRR